MADKVTNELLLEHLKAIQGKLARHDEAFQRIEGEVKVLKTHIYGLVQAEMGRDPTWHPCWSASSASNAGSN